MCGYTETFLIHLKSGTAIPHIPFKEGSLENYFLANFAELLGSAGSDNSSIVVVVGFVIK